MPDVEDAWAVSVSRRSAATHICSGGRCQSGSFLNNWTITEAPICLLGEKKAHMEICECAFAKWDSSGDEMDSFHAPKFLISTNTHSHTQTTKTNQRWEWATSTLGLSTDPDLQRISSSTGVINFASICIIFQSPAPVCLMELRIVALGCCTRIFQTNLKDTLKVW